MNAVKKIGIVAPSSGANDPVAHERGLQRLRDLGHQVTDFSAIYSPHQRFAADDAARLAQLHAAARDPEIDVVIALRGGYGLSRLLPEIDFELLANSGKQWVGHSDFTALQMGLLAQTGAGSFAGPMICDDFSRLECSAFTQQHFWQCLDQSQLKLEVQAAGSPELSLEGRLWGGNLAILAHLVGTPWMPVIDGGILFIEDVNEHPYRVERMLLQLWHAGILQRQKAVLFGDFSGYRLSEHDRGYDFSSMLDWLAGHTGLPLLRGLPFGHTVDKLTLPVGAHCHLVSNEAGYTLTLDRSASLPHRV